MRKTPLLLAAFLSLGVTVAQAQATAPPSEPEAVSVSFSPKVRFYDAGETRLDEERTQANLAQHFQALGKRWLPPGARLRIDVTEIDLAGHVPMGRINNPRVMTGGADWPRMELRYELTRADGQVESGKELLSDMDYLRSGRGFDYSNDALKYEKRMLDAWFQKRFATPAG